MKLLKRAAFVVALFLLFRGLVALGVDAVLDSLIQAAIGDDGVAETTVLNQSSWLAATAEPEEIETMMPIEIYEEPEPIVNTPIFFRQTAPVGQDERLESLPDPSPLPIAELPIFQGERINVSPADIQIHNQTRYEIDIAQLLAEPLVFDPSAGGNPTVLILHTHGTEAFEPTEDAWYYNTHNYRSLDESLNILRVGDEIAAVFEARGIHVIHERGIFDYPSFRGSYERSLEAAMRHLAENPDIQLIFDIHRDAVMDASGNFARLVGEIDGLAAGPIMLVVGTDHAGLYHPNWRENLKFALRLQVEMMERHPALVRPISLQEERFNAHLTPGSVLVEVGTCTNTLQEALVAARFFADAAAEVILNTG